MPEVTINIIGYLSDVKPGDILYYTDDDSNNIIEVTVDHIEFMRYDDGYHATWIGCQWKDPDDGETVEDSISVCLLFRSKEDALKHLIEVEKKYINDLNDWKAKAQVRIMDLEEQITQLHV